MGKMRVAAPSAPSLSWHALVSLWGLIGLALLVSCGHRAALRDVQLTGPGATPTRRLFAAGLTAEPAPLPPRLWGRPGGQAAPLYTDPGELPHLRVGSSEERLPLEHTAVRARVVDFVAEVEVTQTYGNPSSEPLEVVYVFPLPENSAVSHLRMQIGDRVVEADIAERHAARRIYREARAAGHTTALLEQERPNVFTQSVANVAPGERIDVVVRYTQDLTYDSGQYEFVFPMVVGPRHFPGAALSAVSPGPGTKAATDRVPDADRVSPPYVGDGSRSGHDISVELVVDSSLAITGWESPTHELRTRQPADGTLLLTLAPHESLPNRDFILRYRVAGMTPTARLYVSPEGPQGSFFSLVIVPPVLDVDALVGARELIFVVDRSGSMTGVPLALARRAMLDALGRLRPVDTFNVITFSDRPALAFAEPRPANRANVLEAMRVVDGLEADGVTEMGDAVAMALAPSVGAGRHRYVFFLTDGLIGNEITVIGMAQKFVAAQQRRGQRARVFAFGIGAAPNRHLLDGLARAGNGIAIYASVEADAPYAVNQFFHYLDRTVMTDVRVEWGSLVVSDVTPDPLPDLFASHPVVLHGRFTGSPIAPGRVVGRVGDRDYSLPILLHPAPLGENRNAVLAGLWARAQITDLEQALAAGDPNAQQEITRLGLDFHLVTPFTSLVAVDRSRVVGVGSPRRVVQPLERPRDVDLEAAGGEEAEESGFSFDDDPLDAKDSAPMGSQVKSRLRAARPKPFARDRFDVASAAREVEADAPAEPVAPPKPAPPSGELPGPYSRIAGDDNTSSAPAVPPPRAFKPSEPPPQSGEISVGRIAGDATTSAPTTPASPAAEPTFEPTDAESLRDICEIDPEACPTLDLDAEQMSLEESRVYAVQQVRGCGCRIGVPDRVGGGAGALFALASLLLRRRGAGVRCTRRRTFRRESLTT